VTRLAHDCSEFVRLFSRSTLWTISAPLAIQTADLKYHLASELIREQTMTARIFKEVGGSRILVAPAEPELFPREFDRQLWRLDATGHPDNALAAQVRRDGFVLGRVF